jgi:NAD(P)-dependent dehydrogenase (short-subunit alcohol dehydrogenase family)
VFYDACDSTRLTEVDRAVSVIVGLDTQIDVLINNAATPGAPSWSMTVDGNERTLQVNLLAPALLTDGLLSLVRRGGRIVNVASAAHRFADLDLNDPDFSCGYEQVGVYQRSKSGVVTWSLSLATQL